MTAGRTSDPGSSLVGFALIGSEMAGFTVVGVVIDVFAGSAPWATAGFTLAGFAAAFFHLAQIVRGRNRPGGDSRAG